MSLKRSASDALLDALAQELEQLKRSFARYVEGLERVPPTADATALRSKILAAQAKLGTNAAIAYRYANLKSSLVTHEALWNRQLGQIEAGTLPAHRARAADVAARVAAAKAVAAKATEEGNVGEANLDAHGADTHASALPAATAPDAAAQKAAAAGQATNAALAQLHRALADAARLHNAPVPTVQALAADLAQKVARVRSETGQRGVEVRVVVEDGVAQVKVSPKP